MTHAVRLDQRLAAVDRDTTSPVDTLPSDVHEEPPATDGRGARPLSRRALSALFTLALLAAIVYLWPAQLGGESRLVIVSGDSMEPTYDYGDMVLTRDRSHTHIGDVVVFEIPDGGAKGMVVIHRVLLVDEEGYFITQGDNRETPDEWQLTEDDIVGQPMLHIPHGGEVVWLLQQRSVLGVIIGLLVVLILWPKREPDGHEVGADDDPVATSPPDAVWIPTRDRSPVREIDAATMDAANAWLDEQLGLATDHDVEVRSAAHTTDRPGDEPHRPDAVAEPAAPAGRIRALHSTQTPRAEGATCHHGRRIVAGGRSSPLEAPRPGERSPTEEPVVTHAAFEASD